MKAILTLSLLVVLLLGCAPSVEELEEQLHNGDWRERYDAIKEVRERGLTDLLLLGLTDPESHVRNTAIDGLVEQGEEAVEPLLARLEANPTNKLLLVSAVRVLSQLGDNAVARVARQARFGSDLEAETAFLILADVPEAEEALGELLAKPDFLLKLLRSTSVEVRITALKQLFLTDDALFGKVFEGYFTDEVIAYEKASPLTEPIEPFPGGERFGQPLSGEKPLENFTALTLALDKHRRELIRLPIEEAMYWVEGFDTEEPQYEEWYAAAPWGIFLENCAATGEKLLESGRIDEELTELLDRLYSELSLTLTIASGAQPTLAGSYELVRQSLRFAYLRGDLIRLGDSNKEPE